MKFDGTKEIRKQRQQHFLAQIEKWMDEVDTPPFTKSHALYVIHAKPGIFGLADISDKEEKTKKILTTLIYPGASL